VSVQEIRQYIGYCDRCGEPSPEIRDSYEAAALDAEDCPCRSDEP